MSRASGLWSPMVSDHELGGWHALGPVVVGGCHAFGTCALPRSPIMSTIGGLPWSPIMSRVGVTCSGVSRASGLWSPTVSDHEHNWGYWGRVGVTRSGLRSPMVSDHEHNWGQLGAGGCHALRGLWSPTVSDHERNWGHWGRVGVTRSGLCSPTWSPIMSTIAANWGRVGVTRFAACGLHGLRS